jgi:hypothetical protein
MAATLAALAACGGTPPPAPAGAPAPGVSPAVADGDGARATSKPGAPVDLAMSARPLAASGAVDRYEIVLTATPRRAVQWLALTIDGRSAQVAAVAGGANEGRAVVELPRGDGKDVIGTAVFVVDGHRMTAATEVRVGAPAPEPPTGTTLQLPDGTRVQEVRP